MFEIVLLTSECEIKTNTMQNYILKLSIIMHIPNEIINQSKSLVTSLDGINGTCSDVFSGSKLKSGWKFRLSCAVGKIENFWRPSGTVKLGTKAAGCDKSLQSLVAYSHNCTLASGEQSFLLSAKWKVSLLASAHDCETGLLTTKHAIREFHSHAQNVRALHQSEA